jgi:hypothetical protein
MDIENITKEINKNCGLIHSRISGSYSFKLNIFTSKLLVEELKNITNSLKLLLEKINSTDIIIFNLFYIYNMFNGSFNTEEETDFNIYFIKYLKILDLNSTSKHYHHLHVIIRHNIDIKNNKNDKDIINALFYNKQISIEKSQLFINSFINTDIKGLMKLVYVYSEELPKIFIDLVEEYPNIFIKEFVLLEINSELNREFNKIIFDKYKNIKKSDSINAMLYHYDLLSELNDISLINNIFLNFCYSNELINFIYKYVHYNNFNPMDKFTLKLKEKIKDKYDILLLNDNYIKKLEYFFDNKIIPTAELLHSIIKFEAELAKSLRKNHVFDITILVNIFVNFGYMFTLPDLNLMLKYNMYITNINDYDHVNKNNKKLIDICKKKEIYKYFK